EPNRVALIQTDGDYRPHVQAVHKGSVLELSCADDKAVFHAVGALDAVESVVAGRPATRALDRRGLIEMRSELAPWMWAYVHVFDHDFFAATSSRGEFRLPPVVPGKYRLALWHAGWKLADAQRFTPSPALQTEVEVEVGPGKGALVEW